MTDQLAAIDRFRTLHEGPGILLMPNAWDAGSARVLAHLGFQALATTSSGHAATFGRMDGSVTRDEALAHARDLVAATDLPVSADLEHGYADDPDAVAVTFGLAREAGLAGCSIEDTTGRPDDPVYDAALAADRVRAAAEAVHTGDARLALTARADGMLRGHYDLTEAIARLQAFQEAGADVLFAPGARTLDEIRTLVSEVDLPVSVLASAGAPTVAELAEAGVRRISVGGGFAYAALGGLVDAATELLEHGTTTFWDQAGRGWTAARSAFT